MASTDTYTPRLLRRRTDGATFVRIAPPAAFLSHLIVGEQFFHPAPVAGLDCAHLAASAYDAGARMSVRRLPAGYRTSRDA